MFSIIMYSNFIIKRVKEVNVRIKFVNFLEQNHNIVKEFIFSPHETFG